VTTDAFQRLYAARPFHPFFISLADGRSLRVRHPEIVTFSRGGLIAYVENDERMVEVVDLLLVVSLRPMAGRAITR